MRWRSCILTIYGSEHLYDRLLSKAHSLSTNQDYEDSTSCNEELGGGNTGRTANRVKHSFLSPKTNLVSFFTHFHWE